ncbi:hypothetical protein Vadar_005785 [Vaccinium darrowii]|uniref:Uncharacterized protein n=1 Tax=Vaccinium darrowii TaxID=229202 RepID=A0ACB7Z261_9ERIC|nr:hypothetical protein Vadar_005785 [Vaccinium darrowii]
MVNGEEMRKNRSQHGNCESGKSTVFMTVSKPDTAASNSSSYASFPFQQSQVQHSHNTQQQFTPQSTPMYPQPPPMFPALYPQQQNRNWNASNKSRGYKNQRNGPKSPCQICNKTNHTAKDCYYRANLTYQPPSYYNNAHGTFHSSPQAHMLQYTPQSPFPASHNPTAGLLPLPQAYSTTAYPSTYSTPNYPLPSPSFPPPPTPPSNCTYTYTHRCLYTPITITIWLILWPRLPEFRVNSTTLSNVNLPPSSFITGNWDVRFTVQNPNHQITFYYDHITAAMLPFVHAMRNQMVVMATFTVAACVDKSVVDSINGDKTSQGSVNFNVSSG